MKTLIVYATKHGGTAEVARRIAERIPGATLCDLKSGALPMLSGFDRLLIGSPLYAGAIRKELKQFIVQNSDALDRIRYGLFLTGLGGPAGSDKVCFVNNFSELMLEDAVTARFVGGIYDPAKASGLERFIIKLVAKTTAYEDAVKDEELDALVRELMA